jgi:hypothetical protein
MGGGPPGILGVLRQTLGSLVPSVRPHRMHSALIMDPLEEIENLAGAFAETCRAIGHDVAPLGALVENVFRQMEWVVRTAQGYKRPSQDKLIDMVKPIAFAIEDANGNRDKHSLAYNHQSAVAFTIPAAMWIVQPAGENTTLFIRDQIKEGQKYVDKVRRKPNLKDKTTPELHDTWIDQLQKLFEQLARYVETSYPKGLEWNESGKVLAEEKKQSAEIQRGKISMNKGVWYIEAFENCHDITLPEDQMSLKQGVLMLQTKNSSFKLNTKIKHVTIDNCSNCKIDIAHLLSSVNVLNCQKIELFISGNVPTISIERTQGCQIWLTSEAIQSNPDIVTSNNDQVSLMCPKITNSHDYTEVPIPQQYVSKVQLSSNGYKVNTEPVKHF